MSGAMSEPVTPTPTEIRQAREAEEKRKPDLGIFDWLSSKYWVLTGQFRSVGTTSDGCVEFPRTPPDRSRQ